MEKYLEQILCLESENIYHVYLLPSSGNGFWDVYEQSAVNLQHLVPEVRGSVVKAVFGESGLWLRRVRLTEALVAKCCTARSLVMTMSNLRCLRM